MARSGIIQAEAREKTLDRSGDTLPLWEEMAAASVDIPYRPAASLAAGDVAAALASAKTVTLAIGRRACSGALLEHTLAQAPASCRVYVYGPRGLEGDARLRRALPRLGLDLPADWLVVDGGRAGWLLLGPPGGEARWLVPVDGPLARSLFEAFRVLFWFHAAREGLPDATGAFAFRAPLPAPFGDPGADVALPAGRLAVGRKLANPIADAEIRVCPSGDPSGRAGVIFTPPDVNRFSTFQIIASKGAKIVWADLGLPHLALSRERLVLDVGEGPVVLQLEWPRREAIEMLHRLDRAAQKPGWQFHPARRLGDTVGAVLLAGAPAAVQVKPDDEVCLADVVSPLARFDEVPPATFFPPPPLARRVAYRWNAIPVSARAGAREAEIIRQWRVADEWARRQVDVLRQALTALESEERGFVDRLRRWLGRQDDLVQKRERLRERLQELGEAPPSQRPDEAGALLAALVTAGGHVRALVTVAHGARIAAEDAAAEAEQRGAWEQRRQKVLEQLAAKREETAALEQGEASAAAELTGATEALQAAMSARRDLQRGQLTGERDQLGRDLEGARNDVKELGQQRTDAESRDQKKAANKRVQELEAQLGRTRKELEALDRWTPPAAEVATERGRVERGQAAREKARRSTEAAAAEIRRLDAVSGEPFRFQAPPRATPLSVPDDGTVPTAPPEAPPEIGELLEHQGQRYLAVKTWEQAARARPVAARLGAELVAAPAARQVASTPNRRTS